MKRNPSTIIISSSCSHLTAGLMTRSAILIQLRAAFGSSSSRSHCGAEFPSRNALLKHLRGSGGCPAMPAAPARNAAQ